MPFIRRGRANFDRWHVEKDQDGVTPGVDSYRRLREKSECCTAAHSFNLLLVGGYSCMQFLFVVHIWLVVARVTLELNCRNLAFLIALKENKQTKQNENWGASICFGSEWQIAGWIVMSKCIYIWFYMCTGDDNFIKIAADGLVCCDRSLIIIRGITRIMMLCNWTVLLHFQVAQTGISSEHVIMFIIC